MLFILKKKKEKKKKKNISNKRGKKRKNHSSQTHSAPNWKGEEVLQEDSGSKGPQFFEELYELFKDYFHMAASDIEEFAVRDT